MQHSMLQPVCGSASADNNGPRNNWRFVWTCVPTNRHAAPLGRRATKGLLFIFEFEDGARKQ